MEKEKENFLINFIEEPQIFTEEEMGKILGGDSGCIIVGCECKRNYCNVKRADPD